MIQQAETWNKLQITYADEIQRIEANIVKTSKDFLDILDKQQNIVVEGEEDDQFIFSAGGKNFKLRGIFLPTTMLVTPALGSKPISDNSNSQQSSQPISKVLLQTTKYLKIEPHEINFHIIYKDLENYQLSQTLIKERRGMNEILEKQGVSVSELRAKYKLTPAFIQKLAATGPFCFYKTIQQDDTLLIQLSLKYLDLFLKELLQHLMSQSKIGEWFTFNQIQGSIAPIDQKIFEVIARYFKMEMDPASNPPSLACNQMNMQRRYRITLVSMLRFFMVEMAISKQEYTDYEMQEVLKTFKALHLPFGHSDFTEEKVNEKLPEVIAQYFLCIPRKENITYVYYNPNFMNVSIKARVQDMSAFKKRFSLFEIQGMFSNWYSQSEMNQILFKNFRKMGKDYEIKLIIPK